MSLYWSHCPENNICSLSLGKTIKKETVKSVKEPTHHTNTTLPWQWKETHFTWEDNKLKTWANQHMCERLSESQFIVLVRKLSGRDEAVFVLVLFDENILQHVLVQSVVGRVAVALKLFPQVFFHLRRDEREWMSVRGGRCRPDWCKDGEMLSYMENIVQFHL